MLPVLQDTLQQLLDSLEDGPATSPDWQSQHLSRLMSRMDTLASQSLSHLAMSTSREVEQALNSLQVGNQMQTVGPHLLTILQNSN